MPSNFIIAPSEYSQRPVEELLRAAALGQVGVDQRLIQGILGREFEQDQAARKATLAFSRGTHEDDRLDIDPLLVDLFRHWKTPEALEFYIDAVARSADDVSDDLVAALIPFGKQAVDPLLELYDDVGEEEGGDIAFLLAGMGVRDERILALLLDRLEFDAADGGFCLGLYGDPAAREALEEILSELPEDSEEPGDVALRREIQFAIEQLGAPKAAYVPEPADVTAILENYPRELPPLMDVLRESERLEVLAEHPEALARAAAANSFFNHELSMDAREALLKAAREDADAEVRGRAWASLADATAPDPDEKAHDQAAADTIRDEMIAVVNDAAREVAERGGAAVGLYGVADEPAAREAIEKLYEEGGLARAKALEAMWRSLYKPFAKFFPEHLQDEDPRIVRQALRGAGYFQLTATVGAIESYFDRDDEFEDLREDALFAYAMAMPGESKPNRVRGMLRKIQERADLNPEEAELIMFALDERLQLNGQRPVFGDPDDELSGDELTDDDSMMDFDPAAGLELSVAPAGTPVGAGSAPGGPSANIGAANIGAVNHGAVTNGAVHNGVGKVGRNDPCPCGSGKKYKKCCGA